MFNFLPTIKKLLPNGRAFRVFYNTMHEKILDGSQVEAGRVKDFTDLVRDSGIPDGNLSADVLSDWEIFLGLQRNDDLTDVERNDRISGKYASQGGQGPDYIEEALQASGYPVYVQENPAPRTDPSTVTGTLIPGPLVWQARRTYSRTLGSATTLSSAATLGIYSGTGIFEKEYTLPSDPNLFVFFFFLTGPLGLGDFVNIAATKKQDFITRVIQLKPAHVWCIAQINWT